MGVEDGEQFGSWIVRKAKVELVISELCFLFAQLNLRIWENFASSHLLHLTTNDANLNKFGPNWLMHWDNNIKPLNDKNNDLARRCVKPLRVPSSNARTCRGCRRSIWQTTFQRWDTWWKIGQCETFDSIKIQELCLEEKQKLIHGCVDGWLAELKNDCSIWKIFTNN